MRAADEGAAVTTIRVGTRDGIRDPSASSVELGGRNVMALARDGDLWWALLDGHTIARSDGEGWRDVAGLELRGTCLLPGERGVLVGTAEAHLLLVSPGGEAERVGSFDRIEGRDGWYTPWGGPPDVRSMSRSKDGVIFANVHVGGIPCSSDGGSSWVPTIDVDADVHQVLAADDRVLAACAIGLAVSEDGGTGWRVVTEGLHATYARAVAVSEDTILMSVSEGPRGGRAALYRLPIHGAAFERCIEGLPEWFEANIDSHCLAAEGPVAVFGTADGDVFRSDDAGTTWERVASGLPPVTCVALG